MWVKTPQRDSMMMRKLPAALASLSENVRMTEAKTGPLFQAPLTLTDIMDDLSQQRYSIAEKRTDMCWAEKQVRARHAM